MDAAMKPVRSAARAMLGVIFITSGARTAADPQPLVNRARSVTDRVGPMLARVHPRLSPNARTLVRANGAAQFVGGLFLATGHFTRPAAALLAGSMVPTTLAGHAFWRESDPTQRHLHQTQFLKNLGLVGGLLLAVVDTAGQPGLRWRTGRFVGDQRRSAGRVVRLVRRDARIAVKSAATARRLPV